MQSQLSLFMLTYSLVPAPFPGCHRKTGLQSREVTAILVIDLVGAGKHLFYQLRQKQEREVQLMFRVQDQLSLVDGVLYRKCMSQG